jgi:hypothetical protein
MIAFKRKGFSDINFDFVKNTRKLLALYLHRCADFFEALTSRLFIIVLGSIDSFDSELVK